MIFRVV